MVSYVSSSFFEQAFYLFFRESMIAAYYYLGTSNSKSISFPGYLFSLSPLAPGDRYFCLWGLRSILAPPGSSREVRKAKPRGVRFSIVLVPFLVQSTQPNVTHNYFRKALKYRDWLWLNVSCSRFNTPDIREATVAKTSFYKAIWLTFKICDGYLNWLSWSNVADFSVEMNF